MQPQNRSVRAMSQQQLRIYAKRGYCFSPGTGLLRRLTADRESFSGWMGHGVTP